jgi:hypothetical protein
MFKKSLIPKVEYYEFVFYVSLNVSFGIHLSLADKVVPVVKLGNFATDPKKAYYSSRQGIIVHIVNLLIFL